VRWMCVRVNIVLGRWGKQLGVGKNVLRKKKKQKSGEEWANQKYKKSQWSE